MNSYQTAIRYPVRWSYDLRRRSTTQAMPMTRTVAPRVKGSVIMKVNATASGWTMPSSMLKPRTTMTKASRHAHTIPA